MDSTCRDPLHIDTKVWSIPPHSEYMISISFHSLNMQWEEWKETKWHEMHGTVISSGILVHTTTVHLVIPPIHSSIHFGLRGSEASTYLNERAKLSTNGGQRSNAADFKTSWRRTISTKLRWWNSLALNRKLDKISEKQWCDLPDRAG